MKLPTIACARAVRDGGINAIAALDYTLRSALVGLCDEDAQELKLAFGHAMSDLIDKFINPAVRAFPELLPDDATWAAVVTERRETGQAMIAKKRKRLVSINKSATALGRNRPVDDRLVSAGSGRSTVLLRYHNVSIQKIRLFRIMQKKIGRHSWRLNWTTMKKTHYRCLAIISATLIALLLVMPADAQTTASREQLENMFANIAKNTKWDMSREMLWGYFFTHPIL